MPDTFETWLLSVSRLDSYGLTAIFKDGTCSVIDHHGNNHLSATLDHGLYIVPRLGSAHASSAILPQLGSARESSTTNIRKSDSIDVWHRRLAHLNYADLKLILDSDKKTRTTRTPWITPGLCQTCVETKQQQHVIRTKSSRSSTPFELIHSDLCEPIKHSIGGAQFYIIYIDDCTRYTRSEKKNGGRRRRCWVLGRNHHCSSPPHPSRHRRGKSRGWVRFSSVISFVISLVRIHHLG